MEIGADIPPRVVPPKSIKDILVKKSTIAPACILVLCSRLI